MLLDVLVGVLVPVVDPFAAELIGLEDEFLEMWEEEMAETVDRDMAFWPRSREKTASMMFHDAAFSYELVQYLSFRDVNSSRLAVFFVSIPHPSYMILRFP